MDRYKFKLNQQVRGIKMRFSGFLTLLGVFLVFSAQSAQASLWEWFEPAPMPDFERPLLENGKDPNNAQWCHDKWKPEGWVETRGSAGEVIRDFYTGGIITDQYKEDGVHVLEVGKGFMNLSSIDKRRIAAFFDHVYNVTESADNGMFFIYHWKTEEPIGIYTKHGLQIQ